MKNKIMLDISFVYKNKSGVGVYVDTLREIIGSNYDVFEFTYPKIFNYIKYILYILWLNSFFYFKTFFLDPKEFIFPGFIMPYFTHKKHKYYVVIHDLTGYRENEMSKHARFIHKLSVKTALKKANKIIVVSNTVKNEIIQRFNTNPKKISVVHNAIAPYFMDFKDNVEILKKYEIEDKKYILSVATLNKRKNIPSLIKAFEEISDRYPDIKLVLVGGMGNEDREKLTHNKNIIFTDYIADKEIPILYKHALIYLFPSLYEGFGTPIMEAQYSGTPLICSDIPVFREVAGEGAEFCTPDKNGIKNAIELLINDENKRNSIMEVGKQNVKRFDIEKVKTQFNDAMN